MWVAAVVTLLAFLASATAFFHTSARLGSRVTRAAFAGVKYAPCTQSSQLKSSGSTRLYSQPTTSDAHAEESQQVMPMNPRDTSIGVISKVDLSNVGEDITISPPVEGVTKIAMKFGGSSLATAERVLYVAKLIMRHVEQGYQPSIVCSAMGKTTNTLLSAGEFALQGSINVDSLRTLHLSVANTLGLSNNTMVAIEELLAELERLLEGIKYIGELTPRTKDTLVSFGERMSIRIMAATLNKLGVPAQAFDSWTIGMRTTSEFGNADVLDETYTNMRSVLGKLDGSIVPVVTGFIGHDPQGRITTLGRGGSDLSATVIGSAMGLHEVQVWKDVDGIMSTDPRLVKAAQPVTEVTYEEAAELAFFGAQVLHPISMQPAIKSKIPVRVKNSYNPDAKGTLISETRDKSETLVTAITSKSHVQMVDIVSTRMLGQYGFLSEVFSLFDHCQLSVDMMASSDVSVSVTLDKKEQEQGNVKMLLEKLGKFSDVTVYEDRCIISLISNLDRSSETMATAFKVLEDLGITVEMLSQGASKVNISLVVRDSDKDTVIKALHEHFFEGKQH